MTAHIVCGTPGTTFRLELKEQGALRWTGESVLEGDEQVIRFNLPTLGNANELVWVLDHAIAGDFGVLDSLSFTTTTQITDTATAAFVWSQGMLLHNWNPEAGMVRDKARDASGEFDAIQATGRLAAATAIAEQLGIVSRGDAIQIVFHFRPQHSRATSGPLFDDRAGPVFDDRDHRADTQVALFSMIAWP